MASAGNDVVYPAKFDESLGSSKTKNKNSVTVPVVWIAAAVLCLIILCVIIGIACFYGGRSNATSRSTDIEDLKTLQTPKSTDASEAKTQPRPEELKLPKDLSPIRYDVSLKTYLPSRSVNYQVDRNFTFDGQLTLYFRCLSDTNSITLNANQLIINVDSFKLVETNERGSINGKMIDLTDGGFTIKEEFEMVVFKLKDGLKANRFYKLSLVFRGDIRSELKGLYRGSYEENGEQKWLAVTQCEPVDARRIFPLFDEPEFKARYVVSVTHPSDMIALSNALEKTPSDNLGEGWVKTSFKESPLMSSYLFAIAVGNFTARTSHSKNGILFRIWSRPSFASHTKYASEIGPGILDRFEEYFGLRFPLEKLDMIALPDFEAGAMENWGLITYREKNLLYDSTVYALSNKMRVAEVIAHELAHMWFDNLVTMKWWDDIWLNEGFATYMENVGVEHATQGHFHMWDQFALTAEGAMGTDQMTTSHPLVIPIAKATDVMEIFDIISYYKGATIIKMMTEVVGEYAFNLGLTNYLKKYEYSNADHQDLWRSISEAVFKHNNESVPDWEGNALNVSEFAAPWCLQMGFPVVTVTRDYANHTATLSQQRFTLQTEPEPNPRFDPPPFNYKWQVPIWFKSAAAPHTAKPAFMWLNKKQDAEIRSLNTDGWLLVNVDDKAYFRTNYDKRNWKMLADQLVEDNTKISVKSRYRLIEDAFTLASADQLDYETALDLTRSMEHEDHYLPLSATLFNLLQIRNRIELMPGFQHFQAYMRQIMKPLYDKYNWDYKIEENDVLTQNLQRAVIGITCKLGDDDCNARAIKLFNQCKKNCSDSGSPLPFSSECNPIPPSVRTVVYCARARHGSIEDWEYLWQIYQLEQVQVEKARLQSALTCTEEASLLNRLLNASIEGKGIRTQDAPIVWYAVGASKLGKLVIWPYFVQHWDDIHAKFGDQYFLLRGLVRGATSQLSGDYGVDQLESFMETHREQTDLIIFKQQLEATKTRAAWLNKYYDRLVKWFREQIRPNPSHS